MLQIKIKNGANSSKKVGRALELIEAIDDMMPAKLKKNVYKGAGRLGTFLSLGGEIIYSGVEYINGEISGYRFTYRLGGATTSIIAGSVVGSYVGGQQVLQ